MIILRPYLISTFVGLFSISAFAQNICTTKQDVLVRKSGDRYKYVQKELKDLYCDQGFDGKYFKIVHKKDYQPIRFDGDQELVRRASNVYYHLTKAREFWVNEIKSDYVKNLDKITVRVQIENGFSRLGHYSNDELNQNFNNAWTVPAGETPRWAPEQDKWGQEIWFSPMKKIESSNLVTASGQNPLSQQLNYIKNPAVNYIQNSMIQTTLNHLAYPTYQSTTLLEAALKHALAVGVLFGTIELAKHSDKLFMEKYHYIDTAMIPEIIYHEFSHVALSDHLKTVHSMAVIEGMADYFATRISETTKMYKPMKGFSTTAIKNAKNKGLYHPFLEHENNSTSDFTLGLLWKVKTEADKYNKKKKTVVYNADELIYETRKSISAESTINDLTLALYGTCVDSRDICKNKRLGVGVLNNALIDKGF